MKPQNKQLLPILTALFISCATFAQQGNYLPGYVVLLTGDTIRGEVMDRKEGAFPELLNRVRLKPEKGRKKRFKPKEILAYRRGDDEFISLWIATERRRLVQRYYNIPGRGEKVFMKVIHRGQLNYFHWEYEDGEFSTIEYIPLFQRQDSPQLVRVTQGILGLKKKRLAEYFRDCPDLIRAIDSDQLTTPEDIINYGHPCR